MSSPVPAKSQPLHNFSLPMLKWQKTDAASSNHHQRTGRRLAGSSPPPDSSAAARRLSPAPFIEAAAWRQSPIRDSASESESGQASDHHRKAPTADRDHASGRSEKKILVTADKSKVPAVEENFDGVGTKDGKSKIYIRLRGKNKCDGGVQIDGGDKAAGGGGGGGGGGGEGDDLVGKSWNLRPRKPMRKGPPNGGNGGGTSAAESNRGFSQQQTVPNRQEGVQTEEKKVAKQKFSVFLTRQEIEDDIFVLTGAKPARRPRKRPKAVQKQIDNVCPGLWLGAITPDSYKVSEAPPKV